MNLTVDNSVAIKWVIEEPGSASARQYLPYFRGDMRVYPHVLFAPQLIDLEFHNALSKLVSLPGKPGKISYAQFAEATLFGLEEINIEPMATDLFRAARNMSIGARGLLAESQGITLQSPQPPFNIYDCIYIAHARERRHALLTADKAQADVARAFNIPVEFVSAE